VWIDCQGTSIREGAITGNTIQALPSPGGANVRIVGARADHPTAAGLLTVSGNLISSQLTNVHIADSRGVVVAGNQFFSGHEHAIHVERSDFINIAGNNFGNNPDYRAETLDGILIEDSGGCSITGCIVENCLAGSAEEGGAIDVRGSANLIVSACQVHDPRWRALHLCGVRRALVAGCIVACSEPPTLNESVLLDGDCSEVELSGNLLIEGERGTVVQD